MEIKVIIAGVILLVMLVLFIVVLWITIKAVYESQEMIDDMKVMQADSNTKVKAIHESGVIRLRQLIERFKLPNEHS